MSSDKSSQLPTREAIRKIALGRSVERINLAPGGMPDIDMAHVIHGYVAKIHDNPSDEEFSDYGGTIDIGEYPDETTSVEPVIHKSVLLSIATNSKGGFLIVLALFSNAAIFMSAATRHTYVVNFSHADILWLNTRTETVIGMAETEELGPGDDFPPGYDELETTGNETSIRRTPMAITTTIRNDKDKGATAVIDAGSTTYTVDKPEVRQTVDKVVQEANSATIAVAGNKVTLGDENVAEPLVLDNELVRLMLGFLTECSKTMTPTLMGTMSPINMPNFISLTLHIQKFLSRINYIE